MIVKLMQNNSVDELVKEGVISKRSKYNYLNKLKEIGIQRNSIAEEENNIEVNESFNEYYLLYYKNIYIYTKIIDGLEVHTLTKQTYNVR